MKIVSCNTADSKPVKQEVNSTVMLPPLVFPGGTFPSMFCLLGAKSFCQLAISSTTFKETKYTFLSLTFMSSLT